MQATQMVARNSQSGSTKGPAMEPQNQQRARFATPLARRWPSSQPSPAPAAMTTLPRLGRPLPVPAALGDNGRVGSGANGGVQVGADLRHDLLGAARR